MLGVCVLKSGEIMGLEHKLICWWDFTQVPKNMSELKKAGTKKIMGLIASCKNGQNWTK